MSEEKVDEEAKRALLGQERTSENPTDPSLGEGVELQIWKSAQEMTSDVRTPKRTEGIAFLPSGVISILWGITILYNRRSALNS